MKQTIELISYDSNAIYGSFRPRNNGMYGRFELIKLEWDVK